MRILIVGDIQSCYEEFEALLDSADIGDRDQIIALGDLVDRGPDPASVLDFFMNRDNTKSVVGNHERKHIRWMTGSMQPSRSQRITREQLGEVQHQRACKYFATLPIYLELEDAILAHAAVEPGVPLSDQRHNVLMGTVSGERYLKKKYDLPWYEVYDADKPVIVGHRDYLKNGEPFVYEDRVFGLDTSCERGGRLTGLVLPEFRFVSVPSRDNHWNLVSGDFQHIPKGNPFLTEEEMLDLQKKILAYAQPAFDQVMADLEAGGVFQQMNPGERFREFRIRTDESPIGVLLTAGYSGKLSLKYVQQRIQKPRNVLEIARKIGVVPDDMKGNGG